MRYISNTWTEFHYIWHKRPFLFKDELIHLDGGQKSKVQVSVTSQKMFLPITQEYMLYTYANDDNIIHKYLKG